MLVSFKALAVVVMCGTGRQCLEPIPNKRIPKELGHEPWCVPKTQWACTACASGVKGVVGEPGPPKRIGGFRRPHQAEHVPKSTRRVHLPVDVTPKMEDGFAQSLPVGDLPELRDVAFSRSQPDLTSCGSEHVS